MIADTINGNTQTYGVIGDPITHTFSPVIQNTIAQRLGHNMQYMPFHVLEPNLRDAIKGAHSLHIQGLNVTIPHKKNVMEYLAALDQPAEEIGAVNTLKYTPEGYRGYNTDYIGLSKTFQAKHISLENKTVFIIGAGGSSYAAAIMCASKKPRKIYVINRTLSHAFHLVERVKKYYNVSIEALAYDDILKIESERGERCIAIQTTSLGFGKQAGVSPITDESFFNRLEVAFDIIYTPWETKFLNLAQSSGAVCFNGFDMLVYQAIASYEIWRDIEVSEEIASEILDQLKTFYIHSL